MGDFNWLRNILKNNLKLLRISRHKKFLFFCVCIKWVKSAKKHIKNVKLKIESDYHNWVQIFDKFDPVKQKYRYELLPNTKFQTCRRFVRNDLVERKIKSCTA